MIFGFNIICPVSDELAMGLNLEVGQYSFDLPVNNPIRSIGINYTGGTYFLRVNVNAGVLISGRETADIEFVKEPDFSVLDEKFRFSLREIVGNANADKLPPFREWMLWIMRYGMDIKVENLVETMKVFAKTDIPKANLDPRNAIGMIKPFETYTANTAKLEIYPKSELIRLNRIECKAPIPPSDTSDVIRFYFQHKRSMMGYVKRLMSKFEIDIRRPESFLHPLVVTAAFTNEYLRAVGSGDFYKCDTAMEIVENTVSNHQNRRILTELLRKINTGGMVGKKELKLLHDCGINGALIDADAAVDRIINPFDEICRRCEGYEDI